MFASYRRLCTRPPVSSNSNAQGLRIRRTLILHQPVLVQVATAAAVPTDGRRRLSILQRERYAARNAFSSGSSHTHVEAGGKAGRRCMQGCCHCCLTALSVYLQQVCIARDFSEVKCCNNFIPLVLSVFLSSVRVCIGLYFCPFVFYCICLYFWLVCVCVCVCVTSMGPEPALDRGERGLCPGPRACADPALRSRCVTRRFS